MVWMCVAVARRDAEKPEDNNKFDFFFTYYLFYILTVPTPILNLPLTIMQKQ